MYLPISPFDKRDRTPATGAQVLSRDECSPENSFALVVSLCGNSVPLDTSPLCQNSLGQNHLFFVFIHTVLRE